MARRCPTQERLRGAYGRLLEATGRVVGQATRFSREIGAGIKRPTDIIEQAILDGLRQTLDDMVPLVRQVIRQTKARIFGGDRQLDAPKTPETTTDATALCCPLLAMTT